eukprot:7374270-Pyramimonas_sp.AAC.1
MRVGVLAKTKTCHPPRSRPPTLPLSLFLLPLLEEGRDKEEGEEGVEAEEDEEARSGAVGGGVRG